MDACLTPEHSLLGKRHAASPCTSSQGETKRASYPENGPWNYLNKKGQSADLNYTGSCTFCGTMTCMLSCAMSRHSEYKRCNKPAIGWDTNHQFMLAITLCVV